MDRLKPPPRFSNGLLRPQVTTHPKKNRQKKKVTRETSSRQRREIEAFHIVKSIVRTVVRADRVVMRDAKSYCSILLDANNRKTIVRLHFNRSRKYMSLFSGKKEERVRIEQLEDIYNYAERLQATAREYGGQDAAAPSARRSRRSDGGRPEVTATRAADGDLP